MARVLQREAGTGESRGASARNSIPQHISRSQEKPDKSIFLVKPEQMKKGALRVV